MALKPYQHRKLFRCDECGGFVTIETQKGYNYLRCTKKRGPCSRPFVQEEIIAQQINAKLRAISVSQESIDWMLTQLDAEMAMEHTAGEDGRRTLREKLTTLDRKLRCLIDAYTDGALTVDELREAKAAVLEEKIKLKEQQAELKKNGSYWLEPTKYFLKSLSEATYAAEGENPDAKLKWFRKIGSNRLCLTPHPGVIRRCSGCE